MNDFQRGWFMQLLITSLRSQPPGYLEVSRENLWKLAGAHRRDHFERNASELVSRFRFCPGVKTQTAVCYEPLVLVIEQQSKKLRAKFPELPDQQELEFSEVSTGERASLSLSDSDSGVDFKKQKVKPAKSPPAPRVAFTIPTPQELADYSSANQLRVDPGRFFDYYTANGWRVGPNPMADWRAALRSWDGREPGDRRPLNRAQQRLEDNLAANARCKERLRANMRASGNCEAHPNSGLTVTGSCWGCYVTRQEESKRA